MTIQSMPSGVSCHNCTMPAPFEVVSRVVQQYQPVPPLSPSWERHSPSREPRNLSLEPRSPIEPGSAGRPIPTDSSRIHAHRPAIAWPLPTLSLAPSDKDATPDVLRAASPPGELLVVDASGLMRRMMGRVLRSRGVAHACAADGAEAVALVTRSSPDRFWCVLMAREMPTMDGIAATRAIRAVRPSLLIMGLTLDTGEADYKTKFRDAGAHSVLDKPYTADYLVMIKATYSSRESIANEP